MVLLGQTVVLGRTTASHGLRFAGRPAAADLVMGFPVLVLAEGAAVSGDVTAAARLRCLATAVPARLHSITNSA